jgi:lipid-A-disaccharide synthase
LVKALKEEGEELSFFGLGGPRLKALGVEMVCPPPLNVVGFVEAALRISHLLKAYRKVKRFLKEERPDLIILIDYPDMNLRLARAAHEVGVPVLYYISPQVWAWRSGRVKAIARYVDRLAVILPFEVEFYRRHGIEVDFVGHPLLDGLADILSQDPPSGPSQDREEVIGLFPGSRPTEVNNILPLMLETAEGLHRIYPGRFRFILPVAGTLDPGVIRERTRPVQERGLPLTVSTEDSRRVIRRCRLIVAASGTVTLEAALLEVPMVVVYKVAPLNYWIARLLIRIPYVALVNWVAGKKVVPEYLQGEARPEAVIEGCRRFLEDGEYDGQVRRELRAVKAQLGEPGASRRVARIAWEMMG